MAQGYHNITLVVMLVASYLSAPLYGWSVENINNQQVTMAKWAAQNIPAGEKIAVNDVGAVGYFSNHYIVDLLGLVGDTSQRPDRFAITVDDLLKEDIRYLIIYPEWFPNLVTDPRLTKLAGFAVILPTTAGGREAVVYYISEVIRTNFFQSQSYKSEPIKL